MAMSCYFITPNHVNPCESNLGHNRALIGYGLLLIYCKRISHQTFFYLINYKYKTREVFLKKIHSSKLCYTVIFLIHIFHINSNHSSMNIFSIYIYASPVNIHCHFDSTD